MNNKYLNFILLVTGLLLLETLFLFAMIKLTPIAQHPHFVVYAALIFFLLIPMNIYTAWKLTLQ